MSLYLVWRQKHKRHLKLHLLPKVPEQDYLRLFLFCHLKGQVETFTPPLPPLKRSHQKAHSKNDRTVAEPSRKQLKSPPPCRIPRIRPTYTCFTFLGAGLPTTFVSCFVFGFFTFISPPHLSSGPCDSGPIRDL